MPLISISFCVLFSNASSPPATQGHRLASRASLGAITTSGREGSGGSWTQPPAQASPATHLLCTQGWQRDISCLQRCPLEMGSSVASHPYSCPGTGLGAPPDPSLHKRARPSLPSTFGHPAGPAAPGTQGPQLHGVPGPTPQLPGQQFQDSFWSPKSQETPRSPISSNKPISSSIPSYSKRNTTAPRMSGPANSHRSPNLAHAFGLHTKRMQSSLLAASPSRPV